jgi:hypothetical protein
VFHTGSLALGIPASLVFLLLAWASIQLHLLAPSPSAAGPTGNQLIDLFVGGFRLFGKLFEFIGGAGKWAILILAAVSFLAVVLALAMFFTARGLNAGQLWARISGIAIAVVPLLLSLVLFLSLRSLAPRALAAAAVYGTGWVIWTLGWRFV